MKLAKKPVIMSLAFVLTLSTVFSTAYAEGLDYTGSNSTILAKTNIVFDVSTVQDNETAHNLIPAIQNYNVSDASAANVPSATSNNVSTNISVTESSIASNQSVSSTSQHVSKISDIESTIIKSDYIPSPLLTNGQKIAIFAQQYNGYKYVYGAASPSVGFDCSGFAYYVYKQFGCTLPRTAHLQYRYGTSVEKSDLQAGDLVFFATYGGRSVTHVGVYLGNNTFIHAATTGQGVIISSLDSSYWAKAWVGAKRISSSELTIALA